jgi:hypothetical protein
MQIRTMKLMLAVLGAMSMVLTGCPDGGRESLTCTDNTECIEGEICHPSAKVCVQTCTAGTDCPSSAKTCEAIGGGNNQMICKCSTDALCQTDERVSDASTLMCNTAFKVCAPAGTTAPACTKNEDCTGGQVCDVASGMCKAPTTGATCQGEGKSTCTYGEFCNIPSGTSGTCAAPPAPTCENYTNFTAKTTELGTTGPILYKAALQSANVEQFCDPATPKRVKVKLSAYSSTAFPDNKDALNGFLYVRVNGSTTSGPGLISSTTGNYVRSTDNLQADMIVSFCVAETSKTLSLGFYFKGGNFLCYQANYN